MIKGIDVSHWQGNINWPAVKQAIIGTGFRPFAIIKCSGGDAGLYKDSQFDSNKSGARANMDAVGFYHFAGHNDPVVEADHFIASMGDVQSGEFVVLDAEIGQSVFWCKTFLDHVYSKIGFRPMLYAPVNNGWDWSPILRANYGLWIANYGWLNLPTLLGRLQPKIGVWPFYAIWQYSSKGRMTGINGLVDLNVSKMDIPTLKKYGK
jgi:lysozyme